MKPLFAVAAVATLATATPAVAASDYVQCDGQAKGMGVGEGLARFVAIVATMGIAGSPESDNVRERRFGAEGVAACDRAMDDGRGKSDDRRRSRLLLARAIHHLEAKNIPAALADVRQFPAAGGKFATDPLFLRSLQLSAFDIEAAALTMSGDTAGAGRVGATIARTAPWDPVAQVNAVTHLDMQDAPSAETRAVHDHAVRLVPELRLDRATAAMRRGDWAAAADDYTAFGAMSERPTGFLLARQAIAAYFANRPSAGDKALADARTASDAMAARLGEQARSSVASVDEAIDFARIVALWRRGDVAQARTLFGARSRWLAPPLPAVVALTRALREGAPAATLTGALDRDPDAMEAERRRQRIEARSSDAGVKSLYTSIRAIRTDGAYHAAARTIRNLDNAKWTPTPQSAQPGTFVTAVGASGTVAYEATLLRAALMARAQGADRIAILPGRFALSLAGMRVTQGLRFVTPSTPGVTIPVDAWIPVAEVFAALDPLFVVPKG